MVGASTKISVVLLLLAVGVGIYYFSKETSLQNQAASLESQKTNLAAKVESMREVENYAKKLSGKYFLLQKYLESRLKYSSVMLELLARVPTEISFDSLSFEGAGRRTTIAGSSKDVIPVSAFVSRLARPGNASSESAVALEGKNAFMDVRLDSLSVDQDKGVSYSVSFKINEEAFLK